LTAFRFRASIPRIFHVYSRMMFNGDSTLKKNIESGTEPKKA